MEFDRRTPTRVELDRGAWNEVVGSPDFRVTSEFSNASGNA
jgi:hypothetical protein